MTPEREAEIIKQLEGYAPIIEYSEGELPDIQRLIEIHSHRSSVGDTYVLSTGKVVRANWRILGLNADGDLTDGYDGILEHAYAMDGADEDYPPVFTPAERVEIADIAIKQWQEFRARWNAK